MTQQQQQQHAAPERMMELEDSTCEYIGWNWSLQQQAQGWDVGHWMQTSLHRRLAGQPWRRSPCRAFLRNLYCTLRSASATSSGPEASPVAPPSQGGVTPTDAN